MTIAARERAELCDLAEEVGPDAPTLCAGWDVRHLLAHLLVREGSPAAVGIAVPPLARLTDSAIERRSRDAFPALVERLRSGPPRLSLFGVPGADRLLNSVEMFVHHEDVRRAAPAWEPRDLPRGVQDALWRSVRLVGRGLVSSVRAGVVAERSDTGERARLRKGDPAAVLTGLPAEILLAVHGRGDHARVEVAGDPSAVAAFRDADLGV